MKDLEVTLVNNVSEGNLEVVKRLIADGVNIHARNDEAVIEACIEGHLEIVKYLVDKGADIRTRGNEAVIGACIDGYVSIVEYLISQGVNISTGIPLAIAKAKENIDMVRILKEAGTKEI